MNGQSSQQMHLSEYLNDALASRVLVSLASVISFYDVQYAQLAKLSSGLVTTNGGLTSLKCHLTSIVRALRR